MSLSGGISRISSSLQTFTMLTQLQQNTLRVFRDQQILASGKQLLSVSDNPLAADKIGRLHQALQRQDQILANLQHADGYLSATDTAISDVGDLLDQAARIASEQAGTLQSAEERSSQAQVVDSLIDQLLNVGNRQFQGQYIFGGRQVSAAPLNTALGRVTWVGDAGDRQTLVSEDFARSFNISIGDLYGLDDESTGGYADFDVQLNPGGRITELAGALENGVQLGRISVTETGPNINFEVDFSGAETISDLVARFNDAAATAGSSLTLGINPADGATLQISSGLGNGISVAEVNNGTLAADLGIKKTVAAGLSLDGNNINRRVTETTLLSDLKPGGLALPSGIVVTNGARTKTLTFAGATRVQDVLNTLNASGMGIKASINADGDGIEIANLIAGSSLVIGENGGSDAEGLGIKTVDSSVSLSRLNGGLGIHPVEGDDLRVTNALGVSFDVDLSAAKTIGEVISAINTASTAAGAGVVATTSQGGAGFHLSGPAGAGALTVAALNVSPVAGELGILKTGTATDIEGDNVGQFYQSGVLSALYRLRDALASDDSRQITLAGGLINTQQREIAASAGEVGARSKAMRDRLDQTDDAVSATKILLSQVEDVDFTEAVSKFQQAQVALQASLMASSRTQNLSLLDYLQ
jgi:flagellar hook-associated protein 3 FlgL